MTYPMLKTQMQEKMDALIIECRMFFAFSKEQFEKSKTHLDEGDVYVHWGAGGYLPKSLAETFNKKGAEIQEWLTEEILKHDLKEAHILYELQNHECFYTGEIEAAVDVLDYPYQDILDVYRKNYHRMSENL